MTNQTPGREAGHRTNGALFATTHWSVVLEAGQGDAPESLAALETLCRAYWPAIYAFVRRKGHHPEDALDLTQQFFERLLAKGWLASASAQRGRFRTFLLTILQRFLADEFDRATAQKRGGGRPLLSLDEMAAAEEQTFEPSGGRSPEQEFDRRWALAALQNALRSLGAEAERAGHGELFQAMQGFLDGGDAPRSLVAIGARFQLGESAVKMRLSRWRARYRELLREEIAHTVPRAADLDEEMRHLLGALLYQ